MVSFNWEIGAVLASAAAGAAGVACFAAGAALRLAVLGAAFFVAAFFGFFATLAGPTPTYPS